jgi:hypothetical protein
LRRDENISEDYSLLAIHKMLKQYANVLSSIDLSARYQILPFEVADGIDNVIISAKWLALVRWF